MGPATARGLRGCSFPLAVAPAREGVGQSRAGDAGRFPLCAAAPARSAQACRATAESEGAAPAGGAASCLAWPEGAGGAQGTGDAQRCSQCLRSSAWGLECAGSSLKEEEEAGKVCTVAHAAPSQRRATSAETCRGHAGISLDGAAGRGDMGAAKVAAPSRAGSSRRGDTGAGAQPGAGCRGDAGTYWGAAPSCAGARVQKEGARVACGRVGAGRHGGDGAGTVFSRTGPGPRGEAGIGIEFSRIGPGPRGEADIGMVFSRIGPGPRGEAGIGMVFSRIGPGPRGETGIGIVFSRIGPGRRGEAGTGTSKRNDAGVGIVLSRTSVGGRGEAGIGIVFSRAGPGARGALAERATADCDLSAETATTAMLLPDGASWGWPGGCILRGLPGGRVKEQPELGARGGRVTEQPGVARGLPGQQPPASAGSRGGRVTEQPGVARGLPGQQPGGRVSEQPGVAGPTHWSGAGLRPVTAGAAPAGGASGGLWGGGLETESRRRCCRRASAASAWICTAALLGSGFPSAGYGGGGGLGAWTLRGARAAAPGRGRTTPERAAADKCRSRNAAARSRYHSGR